MVNVRNVLLWLHIVVALATMGPFLLFDVIPLAWCARATRPCCAPSSG